MSDPEEAEATFEDALYELVRIFRKRGVSLDSIAETLETVALDVGEGDIDDEPPVGGDAA